MTKDGAERYAAAKDVLKAANRANVVVGVFYNAQPSGSRSLKVLGLRGRRGAKVERVKRFLTRLADRVDTTTSLGDTYYFL